MKVALVHDQLQEFGGAERVLVALHNLFPTADVYTSFYNEVALGSHAKLFRRWKIYSSWANRVPFLKKLYSPLRFITPWIWESLNLSKYDLIISSSGGYMSKGVITRPDTLHVCYLHHQPRYLYYYETAREWQKYLLVKIYGHLINHRLRMWDFLSSTRPDYFIANSHETKRRIEKFYRREAVVIYPPVQIPKQVQSPARPAGGSKFKVQSSYYITVSRLARAKHIDLLIQAANAVQASLKIVGVGRDMEHLKKLAGPTIEFLGNITDEELSKLYQNAKAFLFASVDEEFGIAPVEAMGHGVPVIAYKDGGLKETVQERENGFLFEELTEHAVVEKIKKLESLSREDYMKMRLYARKQSENYSIERFNEKLRAFIKKVSSPKSA